MVYKWLTMRLKVRHTVYLEPELSKKLLARSKKTGALPTENRPPCAP